jgi:hypothetical protein
MAFGLITGIALLSVAACGEYEFPITDHPTRKIDKQLIGYWVTTDGIDSIKVRELTNSTYVICYDGILFRAFHTDLSNVPFLSVQELETSNRTYSYVSYRLSPDGNKIFLKMVNADVIPDDERDIAGIQRLLSKNLENPLLFHSEEEFHKQQ